MTAPLTIKSGFAVIDVTAGRQKLFKVADFTNKARIPVTITGFITGAWGEDDGLSREFEIEVTKVKIT